ncbi:hypothetical protein EVAR_12090_1 [Eumeta japonica]|uniref:Uncharacterized protein n=1 Tax=Eumeta variegata TaxID=151549 RepID=A0A4C1U5B1_EUMVA|nr:hypothetical protein EVAR_12090_1 [Eumeta japonica]
MADLLVLGRAVVKKRRSALSVSRRKCRIRSTDWHFGHAARHGTDTGRRARRPPPRAPPPHALWSGLRFPIEICEKTAQAAREGHPREGVRRPTHLSDNERRSRFGGGARIIKHLSGGLFIIYGLLLVAGHAYTLQVKATTQ